MIKIIFLKICILLLSVSFASAQDAVQSNIPAELLNLQGEITDLASLDSPEFEHHDPSNIIKYNKQFYFWYTEHPKGTSGWSSGAYPDD